MMAEKRCHYKFGEADLVSRSQRHVCDPLDLVFLLENICFSTGSIELSISLQEFNTTAIYTISATTMEAVIIATNVSHFSK